jgi:hypothetical protein
MGTSNTSDRLNMHFGSNQNQQFELIKLRKIEALL